MKHSLLLVLLASMLLCLQAGITYNYDLAQPVVKPGTDYTRLELKDAASVGEPGAPDLPWFGIKLLLPTGNEAISISVERTSPTVYPLTQPLAPIQPQYPFSHTVLEPAVLPDVSIYGSAGAYPTNPVQNLSTQYLCGHPIAFAAVSPFAYSPSKKELVFYQHLSVTVDYHPGAAAMDASALLKDDAFIASRLRNTVDNPEAISGAKNRETGTEYLIVIDAAKLANWTPLKNLYESRGLSVELKSMAEITASSTGADTQAKLRNYLIQFYAANPLRFVLLAADTDVIPHRGFYVNMGQGSESDADIPADMYYSCLDGTWNTDGDNYWGEMYEADLAPEFAIGRYCYNNDTEISNFITKVQGYLNTPVVNEVKTAFFAGEWLWDGPTWGITTLYDRTYGAADSWDADDIRPLLSQGPLYVNHLGHSNTTYTMRLSNNQVSASTITNNGTNHNFGVYFTQGCYSGSFDNRDTSPGSYTSDCIGEKMTSVATTAVGMIAHSRYGWGSQGSTDGASQYLHRQYNDAIFGEHIYELGYTLVDSKIDNIPYITNSPVMYWVDYETNLLGDPAMMLWTDTPETITANIPANLMVGVNNYQISTNAPYAKFYLKLNGDTVYQGAADASGLINVSMMEPLVPGTYSIIISAPNFFVYESTVVATAAEMPYLVCNNIQYQDSDQIFHTGETVSIDFYVKNVGLVNLTQPGTISLTSPSPNITVLSDALTIPALAAGDSLAFTGAFQIMITGNYPDQSRVNLIFLAVYGTYSSQTNSWLVLNSPELSVTSYQVNNTTFVINPGDSPTLSFSVTNQGSGNAYSPMMLLFSDSVWANLSAYELSFPPVGHDSNITYNDAFTVNISPDAPATATALIGYVLSAENGNTVEGSFTIYVGMSSYGFEPDVQGFEVQSLETGFTNQWHRSQIRNYTPNGTFSMKFGNTGAGNYAGSAFGALVSPEMTVSPNCQLEFYHWMDAETHSNPQYAWDGGMVQMSLNGGSWTQITPQGGYPYRIYNNPASPFDANTYVYSGTLDWTQAIFPLGNVTGTARFRWVFGSDGNVAGEGWYVDDVRLTGVVANQDTNLPAVDQVSLHHNYPNPFNPTTTLAFDLPRQDHARLQIFNVRGQLVNTLVNDMLPSGRHSLVWTGLDSSSRPVASGVYYYRLTTSSGTLSKKMILLK